MTKSRFSLIFLFMIPLWMVVSCTKQKREVTYSGTGFPQNVSQYDLNKAIVQINTTNAATGFETVFQDMIPDSSGRAVFCQAFIEPVRFFTDQSGYFYVESYSGWMVAHALQPGLIGTCRINVQDVNGKYYVRELVETAKYIGYGFVEYYFNNPVTGENERKLGFVKNIPSACFFIGSGFYGDPPVRQYTSMEAQKIIAEEATVSMAEGIGGAIAGIFSDTADRVQFCRKMIDWVRFFDDQSGYFFMYDFRCVNVAHGIQKNLQGKDLYDYQDSKGNYVIRDLLAIAKNPGSGWYEYWWNNPVSGKEEPKLAFVMKIPGIDYFIGSGIYPK